jgi:hypothetical protein
MTARVTESGYYVVSGKRTSGVKEVIAMVISEKKMQVNKGKIGNE